MITEHLSLIGKVIRVNTDAVSAHKPRIKFKEIPLCSGCLQNRLCVDAHLIEDDRQLIHKSNIDIALAILDDLGGFRNLDALRTMHARLNDQLIHLRHTVQRFIIHTGDDLLNGFQAMHFVTGVDALWTVADLEIHAAFQPGFFFKNWHANVLGHAGIHRGLKYNNGAGGKVSPENLGRALHRGQIRGVIVVDRRRNRNDVELGFA